MNKFSIWSSYYVDLDPYEAVKSLAETGVNYCELSDEHGRTLLEESDDVSITGSKFKAFADKYGITFLQGHLWLGIRINQDTEKSLEALKKWIVLYRAIGIKNMVLHCDGQFENKSLTEKERLDNNIAALSFLKKYLNGSDTVICLENCPDYTEDSEKLMYIINALDSDNFGICLDTGHLNIARRANRTSQSQREFVLGCGKRLKALHIADNDGGYDEHIMPFGNGTVNFAEVFKALAEVGYGGLYNYEISGERSCSLPIRKLKAKYIKEAFEQFCRECGQVR